MLNWKIILLATLVPLILGYIWYNPKVFGTAWMKATGMTPENAKKANMPLTFGLTLLFSFFVALAMNFLVIHQFHLYSIIATNPPDPDGQSMVDAFMAKFGHNFRTFKHGAFHGTLSGILIALPVIAVPAIYEQKGFKYIAINAGYWIVAFALMGGIVCKWA